MSLQVTSLVWEAAPVEDARTLLVLMALADWANDAGVCWWGVENIALKARCKVRTVQYILRDLQDPDNWGGHWLVQRTIRPGRTRSNLYRINLAYLRKLRADNEARQAEMEAQAQREMEHVEQELDQELEQHQSTADLNGANGAPFTAGQKGATQRTKRCNPAYKMVQQLVHPNRNESVRNVINTSGAGAPGGKTASRSGQPRDPRYAPVLGFIAKLWPQGAIFQATPADGAALRDLLRACPEHAGWTAEALGICMAFRFMSTGGVCKTEAPAKWLRSLTDWQAGPRDTFRNYPAANQLEFWRDRARLLLGLLDAQLEAQTQAEQQTQHQKRANFLSDCALQIVGKIEAVPPDAQPQLQTVCTKLDDMAARAKQGVLHDSAAEDELDRLDSDLLRVLAHVLPQDAHSRLQANAWAKTKELMPRAPAQEMAKTQLQVYQQLVREHYELPRLSFYYSY